MYPRVEKDDGFCDSVGVKLHLHIYIQIHTNTVMQCNAYMMSVKLSS